MTAPIDSHLENLATYLKDRLNEAGAALPTPITVIEDVSYLGDFNGAEKFPLLLVYRTGGRGYGGDKRETWEIVYLLSNYGDVYDVPRVLAWVFEDYNQSNIIDLLINYFSSSDRCGKLDVASIEWAYLYRTAIGNSAGGRLRFAVVQ